MPTLETAPPALLPSQGPQYYILVPNTAEVAGLLPGHPGSRQGRMGTPSLHPALAHSSFLYQVELERERAQLMVRATMAEQQLSELQEYVDQHLGR